MTYQNFLRIRLSLVGVFPGLLVFIGKARLSKVCAHNIEELHLHSGKQGRGGRKQSGTAKRSNDPNISSENWSTVKQSMEMLLKRILTPKTSVDLLRKISPIHDVLIQFALLK
ncbi:unnamed protein product [Rhizophagus irregularis]|nr:unnamed protein product [Rhizophagus irregularis]